MMEEEEEVDIYAQDESPAPIGDRKVGQAPIKKEGEGEEEGEEIEEEVDESDSVCLWRCSFLCQLLIAIL